MQKKLMHAKINDSKSFDKFCNVMSSLSRNTNSRRLGISVGNNSFTFFMDEDRDTLSKMVVCLSAHFFQDYKFFCKDKSRPLNFYVNDLKSFLGSIEIYKKRCV